MAPWDGRDDGVSVDATPPVVIEGPAIADVSCAEHDRIGDQSPVCVSFSPTDADTLYDEPEAIVVGAVSTGAPWFLNGWAEGTEVEFMIDTGCQVTILATSVFERMSAADPMIGSRLRPCSRRLFSADSSPLMVRGELCMTIVFPGLQCDMLLVVASIGSEGLLGTDVLQSCLPHHVWLMDSRHYNCTSNVRQFGLLRISRGHWWCLQIVKSWRRFPSGPRRAFHQVVAL